MSEIDVISQIFEGQFGEPYSAAKSDRLYESMLDYRLTLTRAGHPSPSRAAIKSWVVAKGKINKRTPPKREVAFRFLYGYLLWLERSGLVIADKNEKSPLGRVALWLRGNVPGNPPSDVWPSSRGLQETEQSVSVDTNPTDPAVRSTVRAIVASSIKILRSENDDFFRGSEADDKDERSYYLMYRFSTNHSAVLKSFVVIRPPQAQLDSVYSFNHFVWGGDVPQIGSQHVFRECNGVIVKFLKSYYFVGYNFTVPVNKRVRPEEYVKKRSSYRYKPTGMGIIVLEYDDISPALVPGLTMTLGSHNQPVVARTALLHLGTKTSLGTRITDVMVEPCELPFDRFADDLKLTVARLRQAGCQTFSEYLQGTTSLPVWETIGYKELAKSIIAIIDNTPLWEKIENPKRRHHAYGAIEKAGKFPRD